MTFAKLSAASKYTICSFNKAAKNKGWIDTTGTHDPDSPQIWRILKSGDTSSVCRSVTAPVTEKTQYSGVILIAHYDTSAISFSLTSPNALIWEVICSFVKPPMEIAKVGQWLAQIPHALQEAVMV